MTMLASAVPCVHGSSGDQGRMQGPLVLLKGESWSRSVQWLDASCLGSAAFWIAETQRHPSTGSLRMGGHWPRKSRCVCSAAMASTKRCQRTHSGQCVMRGCWMSLGPLAPKRSRMSFESQWQFGGTCVRCGIDFQRRRRGALQVRWRRWPRIRPTSRHFLLVN